MLLASTVLLAAADQVRFLVEEGESHPLAAIRITFVGDTTPLVGWAGWFIDPEIDISSRIECCLGPVMNNLGKTHLQTKLFLAWPAGFLC